MNKKEIFSTIITPLELLLIGVFLAAIIGRFMTNSGTTLYDVRWLIYGIVIIFLLWAIAYCFLIIAPAIKERKKSLWPAPKKKKIEKIKFSVDVHKSSNWEKDNQFLLCIHNESFLRGIKNISIVIAGINKIENGKLELELNRSVILQKKVNIPKMKGFVDFPFLEIAKKENIFIIRVIHQETLNKEIFIHKFDYGEYIINIVLKRNDIDRDSIAIPIHIKYDGWDKISGKVHETFPKTLFPMLLSVHSLK